MKKSRKLGHVLNSGILAAVCSSVALPVTAQSILSPNQLNQSNTPTTETPKTLSEVGYDEDFSLSDVPNMKVWGANPIDLTLTNIGSVTSQGDFSPPSTPGGLSAADARTTYGVDGTGITIGVISDSYNVLGGAAAGIASGDLPGVGNPNGFITPITVVDDDTTGTDEGRAMLEIIHDLAPGANLLFHSAFNNIGAGQPGESSIATAINNLVTAGADIIVDDVAFLSQPFYQEGLAAQAVNNAFTQGVAYFSAAGNSGTNGYEASFNGTAGNFHDFDTSAALDQFLDIQVSNGSRVRVTVEWDDPYLSSGATGPISDFNVGLFDFDLNAFASTSLRDQSTEDPWELVGITNNSGATKTYGLAIQNISGDTDKLLKAIVFNGTITDANDTNSPTNFGQSAAEGAQAIAAIRYNTSNTVESFSSRGPTTIYFDTSGNPLAQPEVRLTPDLTATNGVDTTFFGSDFEGNGFPNFFGTSAAAPHGAAIAALVLERGEQLGVSLAPGDLYQILQDTAIDIEDAGYDNAAGFGVIDAVSAVGAVTVTQTVPESSPIFGLLLLGIGGLSQLLLKKRPVK